MVAQEIATGKKPFGMFVTFSTYCADLLSNSKRIVPVRSAAISHNI